MQFSENLLRKITHSAVIAVLVIDDVQHAVPVARALLAGGISVIELTLRTKVAIDCLKVIKAEVPELIVGIGTLLTTQQVDKVCEIGADFGVAPGFNPKVVEKAQQNSLPFAPGVMTPSEIEEAAQMGCRVMKFFPAESSGGIKQLKSMKAPYEHIGVKFIPLGGVTIDNMNAYLSEDDVLAVGGSWIAKPSAIHNELWNDISLKALEARNVIKSIRKI